MRETTTQISGSRTETEVSPRDTLTYQTPDYRWRQITVKAETDFPRNRCKHAVCKLGDFIYMFGGKDESLSLKDFWRFSIEKKAWESISYQGEKLPHLEDFTIIKYQTMLYIFGGEFSPSLDDTPLWIYHTGVYFMRKVNSDIKQPHPTGRRDHTAVVYNGSMYVYGGYVDCKGSSSELWKFDFESESWELVSSDEAEVPAGRHGHSAAIYSKLMLVYGGKSNLVSKPELWSWNFVRKEWSRIQTKVTPPALTGHTADVVGDSMFILGGEDRDQPYNTLWRFRIDCLSWEKVEFPTNVLPPLVQHSTGLWLPTPDSSSEGEPNRSVSLPALRRQSRQASRMSDRPGTSPAGLTQPMACGSVGGIFHNRISPNSSVDLNGKIIYVKERVVCAAEQLGDCSNEQGCSESIELSTFPHVNVSDKLSLLNTESVIQGDDNPSLVPNPFLTRESLEESRCPSSSLNSQHQSAGKTHVDLLKLENLPKRRSFCADDLVLEDLEQSVDLIQFSAEDTNKGKPQYPTDNLIQSEDNPVENPSNNSPASDHKQIVTGELQTKGNNQTQETSFTNAAVSQPVNSATRTTQESNTKNLPDRSSSYLEYRPASIYVFGGRETKGRYLGKQPVTIWKCEIPLIS